MTGTLHTAAIHAIGSAVTGTASRTFGDRFTDIINVKDFDALGDNSNDDTANITRAINAAWGAPGSPNGDDLKYNNRGLFFPNGSYLVQAPAAMTAGASATRGSNAIIVGSISGTALTVSSVTSGTVAVGQEIKLASGSRPGIVIKSGSGTAWQLTGSLTAGSQTIELLADVIMNVNSTTNYLSGHMVNISGTTTVPVNVINGTIGIAVIDSTRIALISTWSPNVTTFTAHTASTGTIVRAALQARAVRGGKIIGGARSSTRIKAIGTNDNCFATNGWDYGQVQGIEFVANGTGCAFDYNWDDSGQVALQATTFLDVAFGGTSATQGIGCRAGAGGYQASESLWLDCHFTSLGTGFYQANQNALSNNLIGGNFQSCDTGISFVGCVPLIMGCGFQVGGTWDIDQSSSGALQDAFYVVGCRSEQTSAVGGFCRSQLGSGMVILNCQSGAGANHTFAQFIGRAIISNCQSPDGRIYSPTNNAAVLYGEGNNFTRSDWNQANQAYFGAAINGFNSNRLMSDSTGAPASATFASLPAASPSYMGAIAVVYDSTTATVDATITGGGSNHVLAYATSLAWKVLKAIP